MQAQSLVLSFIDDSLALRGSLQEITPMQGYLRGHGTYVDEGIDGGPPRLIACVAGVVERVNKLISVRPIKSR